MLYAVSYVNAHPQSVDPTLKLFRNRTCLFGCCIMSVSTVALSSGRMLMTAVGGSLAAKLRNRLDDSLRLRNRQGAWEGSEERAVRGRSLRRGHRPLPRIEIFLLCITVQ